jgi:heptosyltransferase-2
VNVGIFIPNWVGDAAMSTPTLRALRSHFGPQARLTGILRPYVADVLAGTPWLDDHIYFDPRSKKPEVRTWPALKQMRRAKFDVAVLLTNSFRTGCLARATGAPIRVGYVRYGRGPFLSHKLYSERVGRRRVPRPEIDSYLRLAYALGCAEGSRKIELATSVADETAADAVWQKLGLPNEKRVVVLNSSGAYGAAKLWHSEHFARLARQLVTRQDLHVLVVCGPNERTQAREITELANDRRVVSLAEERPSIGLTKACVRRSRLLVTTDSGPRFFGVAFGVPVITLFGPTDQSWTHTYYDREMCLSHPVPCGPCGKRVCPLQHHDCMRLLSVERVYEAAIEQLNREREMLAA